LVWQAKDTYQNRHVRAMAPLYFIPILKSHLVHYSAVLREGGGGGRGGGGGKGNQARANTRSKPVRPFWRKREKQANVLTCVLVDSKDRHSRRVFQCSQQTDLTIAVAVLGIFDYETRAWVTVSLDKMYQNQSIAVGITGKHLCNSEMFVVETRIGRACLSPPE